MAKFRKKPVEIEAVQFTGNVWPIIDFVDEGQASVDSFGSDLKIHTLEGDMNVSLNDWVIKGVRGEFYPCKPDIFEATYEKVSD